MTPQFEDQYMDVLQNIEFAIASIYQANSELTDFGVDKALAGLIRVYQARMKEQAAPKLTLKDIEQQVYDAVKNMCDWRLGETQGPELERLAPKTPDEIVACLKRIRKSISLWTRQGGRQGYLTYIAHFIG